MTDSNLASPLVYVESVDALRALCDTLTTQTVVAVDTEEDSLYSYFDKVCLVQFSTRTADYIVDPLALDASLDLLAPLFADARIEKVFHAAEYDILCLKRDYHFTFANIFDTMVAARILGWTNVGLGNILTERFGVTLNKKMQRADWSQRPLSAAQLAYAREDTHYLLALRDAQRAELEKVGRLEEAREEFERLTRVEPTPRPFDPQAYWNIKGAHTLDSARLGALRELFLWRDAHARREDRPPFKILSDATMLRIAEACPTSIRALAHVEGVSDFILRRYGSHIVAAVARGIAAPQTTRPHPRTRGENFLDPAARMRLDKLKAWRKRRAQARGVETDVIVSNEVLYAAARANPRTLDALVSVTGLGPWKARAYGEEILRVLHGKTASDK
jgi:ribonuclease D